MPLNPTAQARWTPERQLAFLDTLAQTRSVTRAAASASMSRESAYRLRRRPAGALFAAAWDRVMLGHGQFDRIRDATKGSRRFGNRATMSNCPCRDPRRGCVHAFLSSHCYWAG